MTEYASLCMLSYNRPEFLRMAVRTAHERANAPFELIVHDDGSDDPRMDATLSRLYDEGLISLVMRNARSHNEGQGIALNRMFHAAKGDPIIKLDHDLIFGQDWLRKAQAILRGNLLASDPEPLIGLLGLFHYRHEPVDSAKTIIAQHDGWQEHTHICGSAFALTRAAWEELGPFEERSAAFGEDWLMQQKVTASGDYVCALPNEDLLSNQGFGIGPSTVVTAPGTVAVIHEEPRIFLPTGVSA